MSLAWTAYVTIPVLTFAVSSLLAYWIYADQSEMPGSRWFVAAMVATSAWMAFHLATLLVPDPGIRLLAHELGTKAATASFLAFAVFASRYSRSNFHRHPLAKLAFGLTAGALALPTFLPPLADVLYRSRDVVGEPFPYVAAEPGILYVALLGLTLSLTAAGLFSLLRYYLSTPRDSGVQLALLILGSLSIAVVTVVGSTGVFPATGMNHATYGALGFVVSVSLGIFWFQLFELQPVARNAVVEQLQDPVFVLDRERRLADYNDVAGELVPAAPNAVGSPFASVHPALAEAVREAERTGSARRVTLPPEGGGRHYSVNVSLVGDADDPDWYSVVLRDVTDLEQSRWQLATQNERLDQVAATVSHDLRNPINVADGFAQIVAEKLEGDLDADDRAEARDHLGRIRGAHERMTDIIDDVLLLAREGKSVEETETVELSSVAREAWETVDTGDARLAVASDRELSADRSKLQSIFENLFRNAVEHAGRDVTVTVETRPDGFAVADDGPGIPADAVAEVWEYGYSTATDGTGFGLSIVRTLAESHGWTVDLDESAPGARFVFGNVGAGSVAERLDDLDSAPADATIHE